MKNLTDVEEMQIEICFYFIFRLLNFINDRRMTVEVVVIIIMITENDKTNTSLKSITFSENKKIKTVLLPILYMYATKKAE